MALPGDSSVQRKAEPLMMDWLSQHLGVELAPRRIEFPGGSRVEVDGVSLDPLVLCEAWAHQGPPKSAQVNKVMNDAFKLIAAAKLFPDQERRLILLFADELAARPFTSASWRSEALRDVNVEIIVAQLDVAIRDGIRAAQATQYR